MYLEDNVTNKFTLLNDGEYNFTPEKTLAGTGRFFLHFSPKALSLENNLLSGLQIYTSDSKSIIINGKLEGFSEVSMYDIQGRKVMSDTINTTSTTNEINVPSLKTGVYLVKVINSNQSTTKKVFIKK